MLFLKSGAGSSYRDYRFCQNVPEAAVRGFSTLPQAVLCLVVADVSTFVRDVPKGSDLVYLIGGHITGITHHIASLLRFLQSKKKCHELCRYSPLVECRYW